MTTLTNLPASEHTEVTILGAMLLDPVAVADATAQLHAEDFLLSSHKRIYRAMQSMVAGGKPIDTSTLRNELEHRKELDSIGGAAYLFGLTEGVPRNMNVESYVQIVKDKAQLRQLMGIGQELQERASDAAADASGLLSDVSQQLAEVADSAIRKSLVSISAIVGEGSIEQILGQPGDITGLRTHFTGFDAMTSGLQPSELIIIAARPSMGKTAWAINIAQNAAIKDGKVVAVFSLEMSKEALLKRMLASESGVSTRRVESGQAGQTERTRLYSGLERLMGTQIFIDDTPGISLAELRAKARRLQQQEKSLDLVVIDYLQLMTAKAENRTQEVSVISRGLKAIAKELRVPVVALSQLSRQNEQRTGDKRPRLSDLRESGSIEQDADVVAFIHREEYYDRDNADLAGRAEVIVAKQRNGPTGTIELAWVSEYTKFENLA